MNNNTKKLLTIWLILATWIAFTSCEKVPEMNSEQVDLNNFMDNSVEVDWEQAALNSLDNNKNNDKIMKIDQMAKPVAWDTIAIFETSMWDIKVKLFPEVTPRTVENFKWLADKWYYNWTIFHRVIKDFMIQWWDPDWTWMWWDSFFWWNFEDEFNADLKNVKWALSMANRWPNTNGSQFFIVQAEETPWLDWMHTVFWQVFEWLELVDDIANVKTWAMDKPATQITVKSIKVEVLK